MKLSRFIVEHWIREYHPVSIIKSKEPTISGIHLFSYEKIPDSNYPYSMMISQENSAHKLTGELEEEIICFLLLKNKQKKQAEKINGNVRAAKTIANKEKIISYLESEGASKAADIASHIGLSSARTRVLLSELIEEEVVQTDGNGRSRRYNV